MKKIDIRFSVLCMIVGFAALCRILPHPMNVTPVGAMALFGGAYFAQRWQAIFVPIAALWLSDLVLNNVVYKAYNPQFTFFSWGSLPIYGSFLLIILLGWLFLKRVNPLKVIGISLTASTLFYLITNFAAWKAMPDFYPQTLQGLWMSYTAALPFFINSILGDLLWSAVLFGGFEWAKRHYPALRVA